MELVEDIEKVVTLTKRGRMLAGLCPFHRERTPSFTVDPAKGYFYCFGCQAGGDRAEFARLLAAKGGAI